MLRIRITNFLIALGLVLGYHSLVNLIPNWEQAKYHAQEATLQVAEVEPSPESFQDEASDPPRLTMTFLDETRWVVEEHDTPGLRMGNGDSQRQDEGVPATEPAARNGEKAGEIPGESLPAEPQSPQRLVIPAIELDVPVEAVEPTLVSVAGEVYQQWQVPNRRVAGWHANSARLGEEGNTVLNGHHNVYGEVFVRLVDLSVGDTIQLYSEEEVFTYVITNRMIVPEKYQTLDVRMNNAQWILPSGDERITLITCWPYESNSHRLILVATPLVSP
jgi:LPXTG-site transpeptidase (sortase) family protein